MHDIITHQILNPNKNYVPKVLGPSNAQQKEEMRQNPIITYRYFTKYAHM